MTTTLLTCAEAPDLSAQMLVSQLARYHRPSARRALFELGVTAGALMLGWALMWLSLPIGYWLTLLLAIPTAGFLVRLFMIQHDCGHGAFFRNRMTNDWVGRTLGVLTFTPYDYWKRNHTIHHASSGNLDRRGTGDIGILTVAEYQALSWKGRLGYRVYRNPLMMFVIGPAYLFVLRQRLPFRQMGVSWKPWISTMGTSAAIVSLAALMIWALGPGPFFAIHLPVLFLAASIGVWLFYVQHQYDGVAWSRDGTWSMADAALSGSSHYDLPGVLRWFTANIGVHHVHHLSSRIPFYRLRQVLRDHPQLHGMGRVTLGESLRGVRLALWDEARQKLVSFSEAKPAGSHFS